MAAAGEPIYMDPTFWVAGSFGLFFVGITALGVFKKLGAALDAKSEAISAQLVEAQKLRDEAEEMLAEYQRKQRDAEKEAAAIVATAQDDAKYLMQEAKAELDKMVERRRRTAEDKIAQAEAVAVKEIRAVAVDVALTASQDRTKFFKYT